MRSDAGLTAEIVEIGTVGQRADPFNIFLNQDEKNGDENMIVKTSKKEIDRIFADSKEAAEVFFGLYGLVMENPEKPGEKIDYRRYTINKEFNKYLFDQCIKFDEKHNPGSLMLSLLWMNSGFSTDNTLKNFEIRINN